MRIISKNLKINGEEMELNGDGSPLEENLAKFGRQVAHLRLVAANEHETAGAPEGPEDVGCESLPVFEDEREGKATVQRVPCDVSVGSEAGGVRADFSGREECPTEAAVHYKSSDVLETGKTGDAKLAPSESVENEIEAADDTDLADVPDAREPQDAESGPPQEGQCQPEIGDAGHQDVVTGAHAPAVAVFPAKIDLLFSGSLRGLLPAIHNCHDVPSHALSTLLISTTCAEVEPGPHWTRWQS